MKPTTETPDAGPLTEAERETRRRFVDAEAERQRRRLEEFHHAAGIGGERLQKLRGMAAQRGLRVQDSLYHGAGDSIRAEYIIFDDSAVVATLPIDPGVAEQWLANYPKGKAEREMAARAARAGRLQAAREKTEWTGLTDKQRCDLAREWFLLRLTALGTRSRLNKEEWTNARLREAGCPEAELATWRDRLDQTTMGEIADGPIAKVPKPKKPAG